jgi:P27 family predicted phage terminase small subunit
MRIGLEKPDWLDDDASWHWDLVATAYRQGILKAVDTSELIQACVWWSEWRKAHRALQTVDPAELPKMYQNLLYSSDRAAGRWQKAASLLGMSPVDRARIHVDSQPEKKGVASRTRRA